MQKEKSKIIANYIATNIETWLGQRTHPAAGQIGPFFSGSHGSPGQMKGNWIIWFIFRMFSNIIQCHLHSHKKQGVGAETSAKFCYIAN